VIASPKKLHLAGPSHMLEKPDAARTKHAAFLVQNNHWPKIDYFSLADFHFERDLARM
jgi:hypothetical protein